MRWVAWLLALLPLAAVAQDAPLEPRNTRPVRDADFGVSTRAFGLDRRVEMLQWQRTADGYRRVWHDAPIDASTHAPGHANPASIPLPSRRWWATSAQLRGQPLDAGVLRELGSWRTFRPDFSALPANLAVTFQPEGDGLGSAVNPLEPQIGDMRVSWRELSLPPLEGRVELRDGRWVLRAASAPVQAPVAAAAAPTAPAPASPAPPVEAAPRPWPWVAGVLGLGLLLLVARAWRLRRVMRLRGTDDATRRTSAD